jgi:uncharacterized RDD family membrane protein YckC
MQSSSNPSAAADASSHSAGPLRRIGAIFYDTLLVAALLMFATALFLPFTGVGVTRDLGWVYYFYQIVLLAVAVSFFLFFWTTKGRTLGMQAWRLRIERLDGSLPTRRDVLTRLLCALLPWVPGFVTIVFGVQSKLPLVTQVGYWLLLLVLANYASARFDIARRSWHDRFLATRIRLMPK